MKLNVFNRKKTALEKLTSTYDVKLDASASQLIMDVLAKLYDNPVEAAIREYVSNAYDANVEAGSTEPVHLHVPTEDEPYLEVSDTGNGLDYLGIVSVFANFGTSTKRDSNEFIGGFGIGSKSGLAISDKIHVSSVCNGLLNEFVIERKDGILQTRFIVENKETQGQSGTTVTVNLNENFIEHNNPMVFTKYHYVIQGWSVKELIVDNPKKKQFGSLNDDRISDTYHKIPNTDTWIHNSFLTTTDYQTTTQRLRIGKVLYKIPDNIVQKLSDEIYYQIQQINMVHDVPIGEFKVNYAREKLDVSDPKTVKKLVSIMKQAYKEYTREYTAVVKDIYIDAPTKLRLLRENQYPFNDFKCLEDCGINDNLTLPFRYKTYDIKELTCHPIEQHNMLNDTPDIFILDDKGYSDATYENICDFLSRNFNKLKNIFPNVHYKHTRVFGNYWFSFCDSAGLYWHINSDTKPVIKIEDILKFVPTDDDVQSDNLNNLMVKSHNVFDMNNKFNAVELQDLPDNADTHVINDNSNDYLDKVYDFVLPIHNNKFIIYTNANDEIDWILKNKPKVSYFTKADMDTHASTIATIIEPLLNNDNAMHVVKMLVKNKQLSNNISLLHLDTTQDTETYIKALYRKSRQYEPKSHNLSFDQKLFIDALCVKGIKIIGKKDAAKIVKRLKLLFPDELKLIKNTADEIVHKVQL